MPLQIFVEDRLVDAYEILALRALGLPVSPRNRKQVRASRIDIDELTSRRKLLDLASNALEGGYDCVMFVMDEEALPRSPERPAKLEGFRSAFRELCQYLENLPDSDPLRRLKVVRVVCRRCLEGWLAADPQAIIDSVRRSRGVSGYSPEYRHTEELPPEQASERIAHIIRETGRRLEREDLARTSAKSVKSRGASIADYVNPVRARNFNSSLAYFYDMLDGRLSGCDHPFPE